MIESPSGSRSRLRFALWTIIAAFGTYFCVYAFRKPFTAASFADSSWFGVSFKTLLVSAQMIGYMLSKFIGIRVVAEFPPSRRALGILVLVGIAEGALILFGFVPAPWNALCLFLNGLPLGIVFGLVLGQIEGRRETEALAAGLCASFILAGGVMKSTGSWLLQAGVSESWMPAAAGAIYILPLLVFTAMLARVGPPTPEDESARAERQPLDRNGRKALAGRYLLGLLLIVAVYTIVTILRSIRDDFAPELFRGLGEPAAPGDYALADLVVASVMLALFGCGSLLKNNRTAFFMALTLCAFGLLFLAGAVFAVRSGAISPFGFMVASGLGLYAPYVAIHTMVFERLLASTRDVGNIGFLMYVADAFGYLGYVAVMLGSGWLGASGPEALTSFFLTICLLGGAVSIVFILIASRYFARRIPSTVRAESADA